MLAKGIAALAMLIAATGLALAATDPDAPNNAATTPSTTDATPNLSNNAVKNAVNVHPTENTADALKPGANSFTEAEARKRIEARGYTDVAALQKDDKSIWHGTAMKSGKKVDIGLDYRGNVAETN